MFPSIDRVYDNACARRDLGWKPGIEFGNVIESLNAGADFNSPLAREIGVKGYHDRAFAEGPYPVD
ncbi:MAG: hypothetical protein Q8R02_18820 [Hyphomonadaceae bacterium]|nr:hypothetical protein [Hyphomonadaceae bacterium]